MHLDWSAASGAIQEISTAQTSVCSRFSSQKLLNNRGSTSWEVLEHELRHQCSNSPYWPKVQCYSMLYNDLKLLELTFLLLCYFERFWWYILISFSFKFGHKQEWLQLLVLTNYNFVFSLWRHRNISQNKTLSATLPVRVSELTTIFPHPTRIHSDPLPDPLDPRIHRIHCVCGSTPGSTLSGSTLPK